MWPWFIPAAPGILLGACKWLDLEYDFIDFNIYDQKSQTSLELWADEIVSRKPKLVGFSLFSYLTQSTARDLARLVKQKDSKIKIIFGGPGIKVGINSDNLMYVNELISEQTIDYFHDGDGEYSWPKFLIDFFDLDDRTISTNLDIPYFPDYSKFDIEFYHNSAIENQQLLQIPITGSRGCVRKCTFCEIHEHWKFSQRSADHIAEEVRQILKQIPMGNLWFTDSLVNGSIPEFYKLLDHFIEIKQEHPRLAWSGQFIVRNPKVANEEYWQKIAESGGYNLQIGVETGSDRLRQEMRKGFTNDELEQNLQYMHKFGITCSFLLLVGYPTETEEDWQQTLDMLEKYKHLAGNTIRWVQPGAVMTIDPGTPIYKESKQDQNYILTKNPKIWYNKANPTNTMDTRLRRRLELETLSEKLGYQLFVDNHPYREEVKQLYKDNEKIIKLIERK